MIDEIFIINISGFIGDSTRSEIEYDKAQEAFFLEYWM